MPRRANVQSSGPCPIRDPKNGFIAVTLPIKRGTELALTVG